MITLGPKIVLANGCFDPLHYGHLQHLQEARAMGDRLIVALTCDEAVRLEKGESRPFYSWEHRAAILRELRCVDVVVMSADVAAIIRKMRPAIFAKGIDYARCEFAPGVKEACADVGAVVAITQTPKRSATEIVERMRAA